MTVFELHLAIDQQLQEQGSYQHDRIFPEAKDLALNEAQEQLLEEMIDSNIGLNPLRLKHIQPLLEKNLTLGIISNYPGVEALSGVCLLPKVVRHILNCRAQVMTSKTCSALPSYTNALGLFETKVSFPKGPESPFYNTFSISSSTQGSLYTLPTVFTDRFVEQDQEYELIQDVLDRLNTTTRWVTYNSETREFSFYTPATLGTLTLEYNVPIPGTTGNSVSLGYTTPTKASYEANTDLAYDYYPCRWVQPDHDLYNKLRLNKFTGPKKNEPFFTISNNGLQFYYAKDSIVTNVQIDYIRNPKKISLILNRTSELDPSVHTQIVNRAVEILKRNIQDPSLPGDVQFNNITNRK
jgi:hypothetical protein